MSLDDYAENMFQFERLHPRWIDSCAKYLGHVFGDAIKGKVFLDYAFGRGNWSLAALKAGAAKVVAVDAAEGNVRRFTDYCREHSIGGVEIVHANILEQPIGQTADILWIYGILPCIFEPDPFLARIVELRRDDDALALLYAYDRGSLRQLIVDAARQGVVYRDAKTFGEDSFLFTPRARLRARDDLTAPLAAWSDAASLAELANRHGCVVLRQFPDFRDWMTGTPSQEFSPHHLLCGFRGSGLNALVEPERPAAAEFGIVGAMADSVIGTAAAEQKRKLAIGLFNTHFSALPADGSVDAALVQDFLFLTHAALRLGLSAKSFAHDAAGRYFEAAMAAMTDAPRRLPNGRLDASPLATFLMTNTVRF